MLSKEIILHNTWWCMFGCFLNSALKTEAQVVLSQDIIFACLVVFINIGLKTGIGQFKEETLDYYQCVVDLLDC